MNGVNQNFVGKFLKPQITQGLKLRVVSTTFFDNCKFLRYPIESVWNYWSFYPQTTDLESSKLVGVYLIGTKYVV